MSLFQLMLVVLLTELVQPRVRETWLNSLGDDAASILKNHEPAQFLKCSRTGELFDGSCSEMFHQRRLHY